MKMKKILPLFSLLIASYSHAQVDHKPKQGISIDRVSIEFGLNSGQTANEKVVITNNLNKKIQLSIYLNDFLRDTTGAHAYLKPGTISHSCANWITLDKNFLEMEPGQRSEVNVKMRVPDSANAVSQMTWAMLFVETVHEKIAPKTKTLATAVNVDMRYGIHIYQQPPLLNKKDVKMLSFDRLPGSNNVYRIICQNTGETQITCKGYLEFSNINDGTKTRIDSRNFPLFPEQKRYVDLAIPATLLKGQYIVTGVIDAGSDVPLEASQLRLEIK